MSRSRRTAVLPSAQETTEKLEKVVSEGNFYGAQQMYKSICARYISAERFPEALDILHSGSCLQLKNNQVTCGSELGVLFVETLIKAKVESDGESLDRVKTIFKFFPQDPIPQRLGDDDDEQHLAEILSTAKTRVECCTSFLKSAIKWSIEFGANKNGSPQLHSMLAEYIFSQSPELDMNRVSFHLVRGENPKKFASILVNFTEKCYPGEDDLAIARGVLMYLAMGNLRDANALMEGVRKLIKLKNHEFPNSDLIQFVAYLLETLRRDALPLFNTLRVAYKASIERDPAFNELLDDVAQVFYGVQRRNPLQGMFGDIFKMMM